MPDLAGVVAAYPWQMWATFVVIVGALIAYASERFPMEHVSIAVVAAFILVFELSPLRAADGTRIIDLADLFRGFADPALVAVMGLLVLAQGLFLSGTMELPTKFLLRAVAFQKSLVIALVFAMVLVTSAFLNDTPVVVMYMPIIAALAAAANIAPSKVMMPLSFTALLGGLTTVMGSSTNILAASAYRASTGDEIGLFDLTPMGLVIAGVGLLYLGVAGRFLLPSRGKEEQNALRESKQFIAQFYVTRGHFLLGKQPVAGLFPDLPDVTVRMIQRRDETFLPPFEDFRFKGGELVIVAATRAALVNLLKTKPEILEGALAEAGGVDEAAGRAQLSMVESVVSPASRMIGRTIGQIAFHRATGCVILGVERRARMLRERMSDIRLEQGDILLVFGPLESIRALRAERDILLLEHSMAGLPAPRNALLAGAIFLAVVAAATSGVLPIAAAALLGALGMLATGCLNIRQAARAFDRNIYLLIGASLAMGLCLERTGGAGLIGGAIAMAANQFGPAILLSAVFFISALMTNFLSNNASVVLLTPIAVSAARQAGIDPWPLVLTVIYGANCPFATPIGYQTNLLVMSPGHYKFADYLKVGGPMILVIWIVYSIVAPIYFTSIGRF